jgi:hypothetical protein
MMNLVQFKMTGGDEVICEVMEWPDEHNKDIIVRNAMVLTFVLDEDFSNQVYGLKPWYAMVENPMEYILINPDHIMSTTKPNSSFVKEYVDALMQMHAMGRKRILDRRIEMKEFEEKFKEKLETITNELVTQDSSSSNVISFPKGTVH